MSRVQLDHAQRWSSCRLKRPVPAAPFVFVADIPTVNFANIPSWLRSFCSILEMKLVSKTATRRCSWLWPSTKVTAANGGRRPAHLGHRQLQHTFHGFKDGLQKSDQVHTAFRDLRKIKQGADKGVQDFYLSA